VTRAAPGRKTAPPFRLPRLSVRGCEGPSPVFGRGTHGHSPGRAWDQRLWPGFGRSPLCRSVSPHPAAASPFSPFSPFSRPGTLRRREEDYERRCASDTDLSRGMLLMARDPSPAVYPASAGGPGLWVSMTYLRLLPSSGFNSVFCFACARSCAPKRAAPWNRRPRPSKTPRWTCRCAAASAARPAPTSASRQLPRNAPVSLPARPPTGPVPLERLLFLLAGRGRGRGRSRSSPFGRGASSLSGDRLSLERSEASSESGTPPLQYNCNRCEQVGRVGSVLTLGSSASLFYRCLRRPAGWPSTRPRATSPAPSSASAPRPGRPTSARSAGAASPARTC